jgi:hypothetical protein
MADDLQIQAPGETLDYALDWTEWLAGDVIQTAPTAGSSWAISPAVAGQPSAPEILGAPASQTACLVAGLTLGQVYELTNTIVTTGGRTAQRTITIRCWQE